MLELGFWVLFLTTLYIYYSVKDTVVSRFKLGVFNLITLRNVVNKESVKRMNWNLEMFKYLFGVFIIGCFC